MKQKRKWVRYTCPNKKNAKNEGAVIVFEDEASFRQTIGQGRFHLPNFQWETYQAFLEQVEAPAFYRRNHRIYLIQDPITPSRKPITSSERSVAI